MVVIHSSYNIEVREHYLAISMDHDVVTNISYMNSISIGPSARTANSVVNAVKAMHLILKPSLWVLIPF